MKTISQFKKFLSLVVAIAFFSSTITASAQTAVFSKPLTIGFLYVFAQKLVQRGELQEAQLLLKKILKSDPSNNSVRRLLQNLQKEEADNQMLDNRSAKPSEIASDIISIQKNVVAIERRNRELEFAIRKVLQENIFLYQTLSRRNKDLLALRKKFFGYDEKSGKTVQTTESTNNILKSYEQQIMERDQAFLKRNKEIGQIMKDISKIGDVLQKNKDISLELDSSANVIEWKNDLIEKRAYLVEKALTLFDKNKDLTALHAELMLVSKSLKEANENYGETVEEYETKIQKLNNVWAQDKARQQAEIDTLKEQIRTEKVKHVATKLVSAKEGGGDVSRDGMSVKSTSDFGNKSADNNRKMSGDAIQPGKAIDFPEQIKSLEQALEQKEAELKAQSRDFDAQIRGIKESWAKEKTVGYQAKLRQQSMVSSDDVQFEGSDLHKSLMQELQSIKDQLKDRESQLQKFQSKMSKHTTELEQLQKKLTDRENRLASVDELIATKDQQIAALKKELIAKESQIMQKNALIEELKIKISGASPVEIKDFQKRTVTMKKMDDESDKPVDELKSLVAELESHLDGEGAQKGAVEEVKNQLTASLKLLDQKDKEIESLKAKLNDNRGLEEIKSLNQDKKSLNDQVNEYQETIAELKEKLSKAMEERGSAKNDWEKANEKLAAMAEEIKQARGASSDVSMKLDEHVEKIAKLNGQLKNQSERSMLEIESLKVKLEKKDSEILDLRSRLEEKEQQVQQFYDSIEKATKQLNTNPTLSPKPENNKSSVIPQQKSENVVNVDNKELKKWEERNNDVYALQQRLKVLSKELNYTQEQLAARTKEADDLNKKLMEKEAEIKSLAAQQKSMRQTDVSKLEKELILIKQQSGLTRLTIKQQEEMLARTQKEIGRKEKALQQAQGQIEKFKKQLLDYTSTIKEKDEQISLQKKALDHEIKKNETLTKKLNSVTRSVSGDVADKKDKDLLELRSNLKEYEVRENDFKKQINGIQEQLKASYVMIEDGESRIKLLKQRLSVREDRISELENEINRLKSDEKGAFEVN